MLEAIPTFCCTRAPARRRPKGGKCKVEAAPCRDRARAEVEAAGGGGSEARSAPAGGTKPFFTAKCGVFLECFCSLDLNQARLIITHQ